MTFAEVDERHPLKGASNLLVTPHLAVVCVRWLLRELPTREHFVQMLDFVCEYEC
jgi:hypothetical protein